MTWAIGPDGVTPERYTMAPHERWPGFKRVHWGPNKNRWHLTGGPRKKNRGRTFCGIPVPRAVRSG